MSEGFVYNQLGYRVFQMNIHPLSLLLDIFIIKVTFVLIFSSVKSLSLRYFSIH